MVNFFKQLVQQATRRATGSTTGKKGARQSNLNLEALEARTLMSAAPVSFMINGADDLVRIAGKQVRVIDHNVEAFQRDRRGDVFSLTNDGVLHEINAAGTGLRTLRDDVSELEANLRNGAVDVLERNGVLDEVFANQMKVLARGVDDFKENTTGSVDVLRSGELDDISGGRSRVVARGVDDFSESVNGKIVLLKSTGELDDWRGGRSTKLATNVTGYTVDGHGHVSWQEAGDDNGNPGSDDSTGRHGLDG
jgi:hypothetical protein